MKRKAVKHKAVKRGDVIAVCQSKRSEPNCMERWNELVAGFVLGNLTPEEAESVAEMLAENPQLASDIARLRNTATVRSLRETAWSTARSQDGSEGWADTAIDLPVPSIVLDEVSTRKTGAIAIELDDKRAAAGLSEAAISTIQLERFSMIEAMLVPLLNPLWWAVFIAAVALGVDDFLVRRSLSSTLEELSEFQTTPQLQILEQPGIAK